MTTVHPKTVMEFATAGRTNLEAGDVVMVTGRMGDTQLGFVLSADNRTGVFVEIDEPRPPHPDTARVVGWAFRALEDPSALPVLGDVVLECGWSDARVDALCPPKDGIEHAAAPTDAWARAIAAVHLFGDWDNTPAYPWAVVRAALAPLPFFFEGTVTLDGVNFSNFTEVEITMDSIREDVRRLNAIRAPRQTPIQIEPPMLPINWTYRPTVDHAEARERRGLGGLPLSMRANLKPWER